MTSQPRIGDAQHALWRSNVLMSLAGNYVESGLDVKPGSSGSAIQSEVDGGTVRFAHEGEVPVAPDTLTHDAVPTANDYRMDVIYATRQGGLAIAPGQPGQPAPTTDRTPYPQGGTPRKPRSLYWPAPPDGSQVNGLPIYVVVIGDTVSDSLDERFGLDNYIDYRIPAVSPGAHTHPDLALNRRTYDLTSAVGEIVKLAELHDGTSGEAAARVQLWSANALPNVEARTLDVGVVARNSQLDVRAFERGESVGSADLFVTEQQTDATGTTQSRYHLYARLPAESGVYAAVEHRGSSWGESQLVDGLGPNDVLGSIAHDTGDPANGGVKRVVAAQSDGAVAGDVPVRQSDGSASWEPRTRTTGEYEPIFTSKFTDDELSTSKSAWTKKTSATQAIYVPPTVLADTRKFDGVYATLTAQITNTQTRGVTGIRLADAAGSVYGGVLEYEGNPGEEVSLDPFPYPFADSGAHSVHLAVRARGDTGTGRVRGARLTLYGRIA